MKVLLALLLLFAWDISPQASDELNKVLRDQLGIENKETPKKETQTPPKIEKNPVEERYSSKEETSESTLLWIMVRLTLILGILVFAFYYLSRYLKKQRVSRFPLKGDIRLISQAYLGAGKELQVVDVSGMLFVLGVTENSIQLIKEIHDPIIRERIYSALDSVEPPQNNFLEQLLQTIQDKPFRSKHHSNEQEEAILEELQKRQKAKLEELKRERGNL
ncbi:MAG: flagellar biosynthetic protein FliO [Leptospiraceae bacterium]|nr:flagellar biosynthetic protein FliO [Leptospiraceae bacterium]